ncbi:MAG TPA: cysteine--tRNA ligase [Desulfosalsimonadaceae bacterium]|nr:cysteine--tRNA ligase [Desulfosalsimonadaceae bacterium]
MTIRVYNTLTRQKESFEPITPGRVRMYVCGPTVYDSCHIGHARSIVVFDVIYRYLQLRGYQVTYARNFTDVDDKIINRANELGISTADLSEKYIAEFHADMDALNVKRPDFEPRATGHIDQIIAVVKRLIEKDYAYEAGGNVFFAVEKFDSYGKLSGRKLSEMEAGARVEIDKQKRNPMDFVLWKASKPNEPAWESPWGNGRPGWHIECSAMSADYLGKSFDIHGGGKDLIFPHHENEIAQSEAAYGKSFVKYWIHNGFVNINSEKMSKSLGNFLMIKDILKTYHPESVRLFLLSNHYRSPVDFTDQAIKEASSALDKIYTLLERIESTFGELPATADPGAEAETNGTEFWQSFCHAMDDDFNTAQGMGVLFDAVRQANRLLDESPANSAAQEKILAICREMLNIGNVLGLLAEIPAQYFEKQREAVLEHASVDVETIEKLVKDREAARKAKDFQTADRIRDQLKEMHIQLEDRPDGTIWRYAK